MAFKKASKFSKSKKPMKKTYKKTMKKGYKPSGSNKGNYATLIETQQFQVNTNQGEVYSFTLNDYQRAQEVAHAYKYYRLAKVIVKYIPYGNVSSIGGAVALRVPQLYHTVDRVSNMLITPTEEEMLERGIRPIQFTKPFTTSFKPNLLQIAQLETGQPADGAGRPLGFNHMSAQTSYPIFDKWLPTQQSESFDVVPPSTQTGLQELPAASNPYCMRYRGIAYVVDQEGAGVQSCGELQVSAVWEYKGARAIKAVAGELPDIANVGTSSLNAIPINTQPTEY